MAAAPKEVLATAMLEGFRERAAAYDRENRFFKEDFNDLAAAGYLKMPIPAEFGGSGMTLADVCREQRRLARYAPATAIAVNMHLYWMGLAADLYRSGDKSCQWMLEEGGRGEVFAAGHSEAGNDLPVLYSTARAEKVDGGYKFQGRKNFGSLTPVWTRLGIHGMDHSDPAAPKVVHAFMPRDTTGYRIVETWDTLGIAGHALGRYFARRGVRAGSLCLARGTARLRRRGPFRAVHFCLGRADVCECLSGAC